MRTKKVISSSKDVNFKANKKTKEYLEDSSYGFNKEEAKFVKRLKRASRKYKGKFPLKWFDYWKVSHYAYKCPHKKEKNDRRIKKERSLNKKRIYTQEENKLLDIG